MSRGTVTEPAPLQEIIAHSKAWVGRYSEAGQEQSLQLHMVFGLANQVEGVGRDANGDFTLSGNYTDEREVYFVLKYHSVYHPPRTFAGTRQRDAQISGRWWVDAGGSPSGDFMLSHEDAERRFAPSYDIDRLKLYYVLERLATGGFGIVSRVRRAVDGKVLVWKELNYARMNKKERRMMITEVNILRDIDHNHVVDFLKSAPCRGLGENACGGADLRESCQVKYYDTIIVREQQKIYLIIEHCPNGDMGALIDAYKKKKLKMEEAFIWRVLGQILLALQSCHNREEVILHRDLKPANILLDEDLVVKVADFGLAAVVNSDSLACSKVGTPLYMAPEQIQGAGYTAKSDMWALGCIIYEMAALKPPFDANNQIELAGCIREGRFARIPDDYSSDLHRVICWMLQLAQENRPSVEDMLKYIQRVELVKTSVSPDLAVAQGSSRQVSPHDLMLKNSAANRGGGGAQMAQMGPGQGGQQDRRPGPNHGGSMENGQNHTPGRERPHVEERRKEGLGLRLLQSAEGVWRVEGLKEDSPAHRSGALFPGDQIKTIQGWEVTGQGWELLGPFLSNLVSKAAASKSDVNILVVRRGPSGDKVINVALSLEGRSHSETVATQHLQQPAATTAPGTARLGSNEAAGEGAPALLSPRGKQGMQQAATPEGIRSPRVPHLPLANMAGNNGPASAREHHAMDPASAALSPRQQVMNSGRVLPPSPYQADHHRKTTGNVPYAPGFRTFGQQIAPSVRGSVGDVALSPHNQQMQRLNLAAAGQPGEEQGARPGSVDSNHGGRQLPMSNDKNGGQVEHLKAQCGSLHDALLASKREVVDMKNRENMFWQKAEDVRQREEAVQRREEAVSRREEQVWQREEAVRKREEGGGVNNELVALRNRERELVSALDQCKEELHNLKNRNYGFLSPRADTQSPRPPTINARP